MLDKQSSLLIEVLYQDLLEHHFYLAALCRIITVSWGVVLSAPEGQRESI